MDSILLDVRFALRTFRKNPAFTLAVLVTLALGIGANTAIFSIVDDVVFRPLPYRSPDGIVTVWGGDVDGRFGVSELERLRYLEQSQIFEDFGAFTRFSANLTGKGAAERVVGAAINASVNRILGTPPLLGREFALEEDAPGRDDVVILSNELWTRRFAGDPSTLGKTLVVNGRPRTVIGVLPSDFRLPNDFLGSGAQLYIPLALDPDPDPRNFHYLDSVARLRKGISLALVRPELAVLSEQLKKDIATLPPTFSAQVAPVVDEVVGQVRPSLLILLGAVGLVLLIACVNVANLLLARAETRLEELAFRAALGAGRRRLVRQLLTESLLLAIAGGTLGLAVAHTALQAVVVLNPPNLPRLHTIGLDGSTFAFTAAVCLFTGALFGLGPAFNAAGGKLHLAFREGGRSASLGRRRQGLRRTLVVAETALALMLALGAGLLIKSFLRLQGVESGFEEERVLTMQLSLPSTVYGDRASVRQFYRRLLEGVRVLPGVQSAGAVSHLPLSSSAGDWGIRIEGREEERLTSGRRPWADRIVLRKTTSKPSE